MSDNYSDAEMIAGLVQFALSFAVFLGCLYLLVVAPRLNRKRLPRAKYARQIRAGIEAAMRGERRTDGKGRSLECRAFNRTVANIESKRSAKVWQNLIDTTAALHESQAASIKKTQAAIRAYQNVQARKVFEQQLADQEVLELEFQLHYPHPSMNDDMSIETIEHIAACLFCRRGQFSWMFDRARGEAA